MAYRVYVTDSLRLLTKADERYIEWVRPDIKAADTRTSDEIKAEICAGLAVIGEMEKQDGLV